MRDPLRFLRARHAEELEGAFGSGDFGEFAERAARVFGTPTYIVGQTIVVIAWIALNASAIAFRWDPYPFILLNLAFSTQAAYAAPLILLAQTRQAERDKVSEDRTERHRERQERATAKREEMIRTGTDELVQLLNSNTELTRQDKVLTEQVAKLTREIHEKLTSTG